MGTRTALALLLVTLVSAAATRRAEAITITFDTLPDGAISGVYAGLTWGTNIRVFAQSFDGTGYQHGVISPTKGIYDSFGGGGEFSSATTFDFTSVYVTGANIAQNVTFEGFVTGNPIAVYTQVVPVTTTTALLFNANFLGVNRVTFDAPGFPPSQIVLDNLVLNESASEPAAVPEPGTILLLGGGIAVAGLRVLRRRHVRVDRP